MPPVGAGRAALLLAVLATSWGSIFVRLCVSPSPTIAFWRVLLASLLVAPWALAGAAALSRRVVLQALAAGALLALHFAAWIASLSYTTIAASTVLVSTQPVFSALFSWALLREAPGRAARGAMVLVLLGVLVLAGGDVGVGSGRLKGDLLAVLGAIAAALYLVIGRTARERAPFASYLGLVNLSAAFCCGLLAIALGSPLRPASGAEFGWLLLMAVVPHLLGHGALNWAVRRLRAYVVNLAALGEPVLASFYALLIFGEAPPAAAYPGAALIGAGVALAVYRDSGPPARGAAPAGPPGPPRL